MPTIEDIIRKHAFKNAHDHGKAQEKAVVGRVLAEMPEAKKKMNLVMPLTKRIVAVVNTMKKEEIEHNLKKYSFVEKKKEEGERKLRLPDAEKGKVVTRFPPEPSGYPHIGHAKAVWLDYEAARQNDGKFLLRFDDTNPEKESEDYVEAIKDGLKWLGVKWEKESYVSDSMKKMYGYAEQLIEQKDAYICTCAQEQIRANRALGNKCACRDREAAENLKLWKALLADEGKEGSAIMRFRGNMESLNTVMRDPTLFRIIKKPHFRQETKFIVWPLYDFNAPIMDSLDGITHAMRTKEYELRDELYYAILDALKLRKPKLVEFSRLQIKNAPISKRLLNPLIADGKVGGWDDPRLPTLTALRRRGILPEAIRKFVLSFGLGKAESEPTWEALLVENKKLLDPTTPRLFFVASPVALNVKGAPQKEAKLRRHPSDESMGLRTMKTNGKFMIAKADADALKEGEVFRLKDLMNVKLERKAGNALEASHAEDKPLPKKKIHWVAAGEGALEASVLVPGDLLKDGKFNEESLRTDKGLVEPDAARLEQGTVVQFERYGFCRLDDKAGMRFIFTNP